MLIGPAVERLISDTRYAAQLAEQCPGIDATIRTQATSFADATAKVLAKQRGPVLVEAEHLSVAQFEKLKGGAAGTPLLTGEGLVESLRAVKDDWEVDRIRAAVAAAEAAFTAALETVRGDESERSISYRLEAALRERGADGFSFGPIVAVGDRGALPHYEVGDPTPNAAGTLLVDWGARMPGGYVLRPHPHARHRGGAGGVPPRLRRRQRRRGRCPRRPPTRRRPEIRSTPRPGASSKKPATASSSVTAWGTGSGWKFTSPRG